MTFTEGEQVGGRTGADMFFLDRVISHDVLGLVFYRNTVETWIVALGTTVIVFALLMLIRRIVVVRLKVLAQKTPWQIDDLAVGFLESIHPVVLASVSIYLGALVLTLPHTWMQVLSNVPLLLLIIQTGFWVHDLLGFTLNSYLGSRPTEDERLVAQTMIGPVKFIGMMLIWSLVVLLILDNVGFNVTAIITGLGIGGIAVALAVQNILGDLLGALSIAMDKPFVLGDFIIVDDYRGTVEHIGLKTTRIRSLGGELIIFSNSDLLKCRIRNYKRMDRRRIVFQFGVLYQTRPEQLQQIPVMVKEIIDDIKLATFDRSHFAKFGDSSLDFETVYFVEDSEYNVYMDVQQIINLALFDRLAQADIEFAYPTQTLYMSHENSAVDNSTLQTLLTNPRPSSL